MDDYISRKAVLDLIESAWAWGHSVNRVCDDLRNLPAADVVPVVRCNECKYHEIEPGKLKLGDIPPKQGECWCNWWDSAVNLSGFCSCGERITE